MCAHSNDVHAQHTRTHVCKHKHTTRTHAHKHAHLLFVHILRSGMALAVQYTRVIVTCFPLLHLYKLERPLETVVVNHQAVQASQKAHQGTLM